MSPLQPKYRTPDYCLLLMYRSRKDERLSLPSWLACSGWFTHISGHPSAAGRAHDSESTPAKDRRSTTEPRNRGLRACQVSSGAVQQFWPQYTNVTDRTGQDRQTGQTTKWSDSIRRTVLQTVAQKMDSMASVLFNDAKLCAIVHHAGLLLSLGEVRLIWPP